MRQTENLRSASLRESLPLDDFSDRGPKRSPKDQTLPALPRFDDLRYFHEVTLMLDADNAGQVAGVKIAARLVSGLESGLSD